MRNSNFRKFWIPAFLLTAVVAGCGDSDKAGGGGTGPLNAPTVVSVFPTLPRQSQRRIVSGKARNPLIGTALIKGSLNRRHRAKMPDELLKTGWIFPSPF
jgi:hypothetical protein